MPTDNLSVTICVRLQYDAYKESISVSDWSMPMMPTVNPSVFRVWYDVLRESMCVKEFCMYAYMESMFYSWVWCIFPPLYMAYK